MAGAVTDEADLIRGIWSKRRVLTNAGDARRAAEERSHDQGNDHNSSICAASHSR